MRRNPTTPIADYKNKAWESTGLMGGYYVVGVTTIPYPRFGFLLGCAFQF